MPRPLRKTSSQAAGFSEMAAAAAGWVEDAGVLVCMVFPGCRSHANTQRTGNRGWRAGSVEPRPAGRDAATISRRCAGGRSNKRQILRPPPYLPESCRQLGYGMRFGANEVEVPRPFNSSCPATLPATPAILYAGVCVVRLDPVIRTGSSPDRHI